jgi:hypothetical protein
MPKDITPTCSSIPISRYMKAKLKSECMLHIVHREIQEHASFFYFQEIPCIKGGVCRVPHFARRRFETPTI